jgi:hypothetical protein
LANFESSRHGEPDFCSQDLLELFCSGGHEGGLPRGLRIRLLFCPEGDCRSRARRKSSSGWINRDRGAIGDYLSECRQRTASAPGNFRKFVGWTCLRGSAGYATLSWCLVAWVSCYFMKARFCVERCLCALIVRIFRLWRTCSFSSAVLLLLAARSIAQNRRCGSSLHNPSLIRGVI